jgi:hypothetical protein
MKTMIIKDSTKDDPLKFYDLGRKVATKVSTVI